MNTSIASGKVTKKVLSNGLTVLVVPVHHVPEVEIELWYNVGSKDEKNGERGMAHLIEHMIFKGSKIFSESDLNLITHKLSGYSNAFTSYDYTAYVFRFPSNAWEHALWMLSECMHNCTFNEEMLASEVKVVVQELKMYKDDYQNEIMEQLCACIFPEHPYQHPIIGYKQDLLSLNRDTLFAFYQKHYHPANATLVIVGDVKTEEAFSAAEKYFANLKTGSPVQRDYFFEDDISQKTVTIHREVEHPWSCYIYKIPGVREQKSHLYYMISLLLAGGKSAVLYETLVNKLQLATAVGSFTYDLIEKDLFGIAVTPKEQSLFPQIEEVIQNEIALIIENGIDKDQFSRIKKRTQLDYLSLLESNDHHASALGSFYLATGDEHAVEEYVAKIAAATEEELLAEMQKSLRPSLQHSGYLLPAAADEKPHLQKLQEESDALDAKILASKVRTLPVEEAEAAVKLQVPSPVAFNYPKPVQCTLSNGLDVLWYDAPHVPKVSVLLGLKGDFLYDEDAHAGISYFHSKMLLEGTEKHTGSELHRLLESQGIYIGSRSGLMVAECLRDDLKNTLEMVHEIITTPSFPEKELEKVRKKILIELKEYWDTPVQFVEQLVREFIYPKHPYRKAIRGTKETVSGINIEMLRTYQERFMTPRGATMVLVGDLGKFANTKEITSLLENIFGKWTGTEIEDLKFPTLSVSPGKLITHEINRDQVVLGLLGPSVSRKDALYDTIALLDVVLTGGPDSAMASRLFALREQTGLFYTIGGSLLHNSLKEPGMVFIKTIVSPDKVKQAEEIIKNALKMIIDNGVTDEEFSQAKHVLINASVGNFESADKMARTFLFLKKYNLPFDLFDKRGAQLSIITKESMWEVAKKFCNPETLSVIRVGRSHNEKSA